MAKYRKTALVDAEEFLPPHHIPWGCYQKGTIGDVANGHGEWMLKTLEGEHALRAGDYVCTGVAGEKWNVEKSIFETTYELASSPLASSADLRAKLDVAREALECGLKNASASSAGFRIRILADAINEALATIGDAGD